MADFCKEKIRNVALIGHGGEGKTSLAEAMLYLTKGIDRLGKVTDGNTVSDYDSEEIARKMSISLSLISVYYKDYKINVLDVPGFFDFEGEMISALTVADGAVVVTQSSGALSVGAEKALDYCIEKNIPTIIFINGLNKENSNYSATVKAIGAKYGMKVAAVEIPVMDGNNVIGVVNVACNKAFDLSGNEIPVPSDIAEEVNKQSNELIETIAGGNDELFEKFFEEGELSDEDKKIGTAALVKKCELFPVVGGVAVGTPVLGNLLDYIVEYIPYAGETVNAKADKDGETAELAYDKNQPAICRIFKTIIDPFVGKLNLFKVYAGSVKSGDILFNMRKGDNEKVSTLYFLKGKFQENADCVNAGDIGAFAKLSYTSTGDTLCNQSFKVAFPPIEFPKPVLTMAIAAGEKGGTDKIVEGLRKLTEEDCTFKVEKNSETQETVISAMGETQIDVLCKKVKNKYKINVTLSEPRIAYRETITKTVEQQGKCKKQNGGSGLYGDVHIRFEPAPDIDFEFAEEVVGGAVPKQYFPSVEKGLREAKETGVLAGCPMVGFRAVLFFGSYHSVDSKEAAFIEAAKIAFKEGMVRACPTMLEPIMNLKITVPHDYMGDVMGDLTKRRGRLFGTEHVNGKTVITGEAPAAELTRYAIDLRSMTQGRGKFETEFARYDEVPQVMLPKLIEEEKAKRTK